MKSYRKELWFNVPRRRGFVNITPDVEEALQESGVQEGMVRIDVTRSHGQFVGVDLVGDIHPLAGLRVHPPGVLVHLDDRYLLAAHTPG